MCRAQLGRIDQTAATWRRMLDVPEAPGPRGGADIAAAKAWATAVTGNPPEAATVLGDAAARASAAGLAVPEVLLLFDLARLGYANAEVVERAGAAADRCQGALMLMLAEATAALAGDNGLRLDTEAARLREAGLHLWASELSARAADVWAADGDQRAATASQRASDEARAAVEGARTPSLARAAAVDPLSRREREVAALASSGASNSDIAERLHVSVRTVETHLQRIYRKLGISRRQDLTSALRPE